ncbi:extracellular solute-binding protein [Bradyrhizobium sp. ARR65]|uniref:extracellular solute-binding protein n=1 Tax=Bradyrhizobium sp. ARR65 TaxID=1040989 RepID=UPI00046315C5|nr:extracellular solute-binding protein [Bradyrhizobium sp. ARR65]
MSLKRREFLRIACALPLVSLAERAFALDSPAVQVSVTPSIFRTMFDQLITRYDQVHPAMKAAIRETNPDQIAQMQSTLRQALINDLPDVSFQGFAYLATLKEQGVIQPIKELVSDSGLAELGISGPVVEACRIGPDAYGLAVGLSFPVLFINATLAERAGFAENDIPTDWNGIMEMVRKLAALGSDVQGGYFQYQADSNWTWVALVEAAGGRMLDDNGAIAFTGDEGKRSLEILAEFGRVGQARYDVNREQARTLFNGGQLGMILDSSSSAAAFHSAVASRFKVIAVPLPVSHPRGRIPAAGVAAVLHAKDPPRRWASWQFMKYCAAPEGQTIVGKTTGYVPANRIALETPGMLGEWYAGRPIYKAGLASVAYAAPWFIFPGKDSARVSNEITESLRQVVMLQKTPEEAMRDIVKTVKRFVPGAG